MSIIDYENCKIYKIINNIDDKIFFDVSIQRASKRLSQLKRDGKLYPNRNEFTKHMNKIGCEHFKINIVKKFSCNNRNEMKLYFDKFQKQPIGKRKKIIYNSDDKHELRSKINNYDSINEIHNIITHLNKEFNKYKKNKLNEQNNYKNKIKKLNKIIDEQEHKIKQLNEIINKQK